MVCNNCQRGKYMPIKSCGGEVVYKCNNCDNTFIKKYNISSFSLDFTKDNYDSPQKWAECVIKTYSLHDEIPKEYVDKLKKCNTWEDVIILEKEVVPFLTR